METYKKKFKEDVNFKKLKFAMVEPSDPDTGAPGYENEVTLIFKKDVKMDNRDFREFAGKIEKTLEDWILGGLGKAWKV